MLKPLGACAYFPCCLQASGSGVMSFTVYTYSVSIRRAGAFPESQGTESLSTLLTAGGGRARGWGVSDAFRNVISSSLIILGNTHQTDDFCPCYRYPRPAVPFDWEL